MRHWFKQIQGSYGKHRTKCTKTLKILTDTLLFPIIYVTTDTSRPSSAHTRHSVYPPWKYFYYTRSLSPYVHGTDSHHFFIYSSRVSTTATTMRQLLLCLALVFVPPTLQQCLTPNDNVNPTPTGKTRLYSGQQEFSLAMLQAINQLQPNDNLFFSPYSTFHALILAYFVSANQTETYLKKALRLDDSLVSKPILWFF